MSASPETQGGFYQFPLCLLAQTLPFETLLNQVFRWGVCRYLDQKHGECWRAANQREAAMVEARELISFTGGSFEDFSARHAEAEKFVKRWRGEWQRRTAFVRFRSSDLHFLVRDKQILSEREWRILAAVFSALGDKPMVKLGWKSIQSRAAGWLTPPPPGATPCGSLYSRDQIERSLKHLLDRGYVFGATYRRGERYWTNRDNQEGLRAEIEKRKLRSANAARRRMIDTQGDTKIAAQLAALGVALPPITPPGSRVLHSPVGHAHDHASPTNPAIGGRFDQLPASRFRVVAGGSAS